MKSIIFAVLFSLALSHHSTLFAAEVTAAVAANFTKTIEEIGHAFTKDTEHTIRFSFGPTGKLFAQIKNGAPFDLFFAADEKTPQAALDENLAIASSYFVYAQGVLALYSPTLPVATQAEEILKQAQFRHLSIANPRVAPYGLQAENYLKALGFYDQLERKLVNGESITHAFQYVATRNAELGFVALSQLVDPESPAYEKGEYFLIPQEKYDPINQAAVITKRGENNQAAAAFMDYMKSPKAIAIIERYGYRIPQSVVSD
ncbi:molybdate ABC transporter substrate-binding protein [Thioflexithrix psekupsensis]|uniref:Molybdate ABC transporter substrate-binding protein n=1 Tax=Thioflexithrix psekupsensis TaxID=1570016 RepID=A0A251X5C2_9GAMM|nr:molybdate ABC transporter substrate-binding protein [Thioflexithrix psekupsensis]OUD12621.1 molybdate ABC transporter substrate-binding protein [Thioflexithrix psekupsensis]